MNHDKKFFNYITSIKIRFFLGEHDKLIHMDDHLMG